MAIVETIGSSTHFISRFRDMQRMHNFSYPALRVLFNYYDSFEEPVELDVIGICCDWTEIDISDIEVETGCQDLEELRDSTVVLDVDDDTVLYLAY